MVGRGIGRSHHHFLQATTRSPDGYLRQLCQWPETQRYHAVRENKMRKISSPFSIARQLHLMTPCWSLHVFHALLSENLGAKLISWSEAVFDITKLNSACCGTVSWILCKILEHLLMQLVGQDPADATSWSRGSSLTYTYYSTHSPSGISSVSTLTLSRRGYIPSSTFLCPCCVSY